MNKVTGIKPTSKFDDTFIGELKQMFLLFDLIGIPYLDSQIQYVRKVDDESLCDNRKRRRVRNK